MSINRLQQIRLSLLTLIIVTIVALSAVYLPIFLQETTGGTFTPQVYACQPSSGSCG